ncbi:precorrin-2 dehydrogenase/sirohydrochlorin ferrochelatase family protein [Stigmatella aurantiaca]|uniref:precorrin-2 dehydrogenase n=2 Tax=Stigmatella aurantiaca (strain DW4/3-1) TaxID=378806 RepID=E3FQM8_STIAD|nr:bifunctional precorrin-2 dehydrogenase/sirohydrochlorin ferrochelatase [Stigmatella aurantiaca]ADO70721.1 Siroheme synthase N-terminal domain protein [Stigmatella aurantiaca DW4/3-1]
MVSASIDYPVCLQLRGKRVLLIGAGLIAESRALQLLEAGARLRMVAPEATDTLRRLASEQRLELLERAYRPGDAAGHALVFVATDDRQVSQAVAEETRALGILLNAADEPDLCDFTLPSVGRRGPITVAVSTQGMAPALARGLRRQLMEHIGRHHVWVARLSGHFREHLPRGAGRSRLLKRLVDDDICGRLARGQRRHAWTCIREELKALGEKT